MARRTKGKLLGLLTVIILAMLAVLVLLRGSLVAAHIDDGIQFFSSDASNYYLMYEDFYADLELAENPVLFMIGSPILFMKLADGNLFLIQLGNLLLMAVTLKVALDCLPSAGARSRFLVGTLVFPYFLRLPEPEQGGVSMCSAIFFACYLVRGRKTDVIAALVLAGCARYYMLVSLLAVIVLLPREKPPRYGWAVGLLVFISVAAPIAKSLVPQYSSEGLLDVSGITGFIFASAIDSFAYALIYPIKYVVLIPLRAYSFLLATGREGDAMEAVVSLTTLWVFVASLKLLPAPRRASPLVRQLVVAGLIAPIPMMWSDIMHWRYYSYVYFFFFFALVIHRAEKERLRALTRVSVSMDKYIVVVSPSYGGAEKRFFDVFTTLRRRGEAVSLIAPASLIDLLRKDHPDRPDALDGLLAVPMGDWSRLEFVRSFRKLLRTLPRKSSFHYPLNCLWPLHVGRGDTVSMSVADCTSVPHPFSDKRTSRWAWLSFFFVDRIDVLSPAILQSMRSYRRFKRMTLTPGGTFMVPPRQGPQVRRMPTVAFLGRLVEGKGLDELLEVLPALWARLAGHVPDGFSFQIAGYGVLQAHVVERTESLRQTGVPVNFVSYAVADALLPQCAVLLSLQTPTNYPSRVVAEALMAGCTVIVRDTGDSRLFGVDLPGLQYCRAELDPDEMAEQIASAIRRLLGEAGFSDEVSRAAKARFSSSGYIDYFRDVMSGAQAVSR